MSFVRTGTRAEPGHWSAQDQLAATIRARATEDEPSRVELAYEEATQRLQERWGHAQAHSRAGQVEPDAIGADDAELSMRSAFRAGATDVSAVQLTSRVADSVLLQQTMRGQGSTQLGLRTQLSPGPSAVSAARFRLTTFRPYQAGGAGSLDVTGSPERRPVRSQLLEQFGRPASALFRERSEHRVSGYMLTRDAGGQTTHTTADRSSGQYISPLKPLSRVQPPTIEMTAQ